MNRSLFVVSSLFLTAAFCMAQKAGPAMPSSNAPRQLACSIRLLPAESDIWARGGRAGTILPDFLAADDAAGSGGDVPAGSKLIAISDDPIDLFDYFDPVKNAVAGRWGIQDHVLECDHRNGSNVLDIPVHPPEEYDLGISFIRIFGRGPLVLDLNQDGKPFDIVIGGDNNTALGLEQVDGNRFDQNSTSFKARPQLVAVGGGRHGGGGIVNIPGTLIAFNKPYVAVVKVRKDSVELVINGRTAFNLQTDYSNVTSGDGEPKDPYAIGIRVEGQTQFNISDFEIKAVTGTASKVVKDDGSTPAANTPKPAKSGTTDNSGLFNQ